MLNLYPVLTKGANLQKKIDSSERASIVYHDFFGYPLGFRDLIKWRANEGVLNIKDDVKVAYKNGFYYVSGHSGFIYKRILRKRISAKKIKIAKKACDILSFVPGIKMIAVTGSLAMENPSEESDIDLLIVTKRGLMWTTRLLTYIVINLFGIQKRKPKSIIQKNSLCLNIWLDEGELAWSPKDRNLYTAHEIAQIVPIINKDNIYEKFLFKNKWLLNYWPTAVHINKKIKTELLRDPFLPIRFIEKIAFKIQYRYMKNKITREVIKPSKALFHPQDWGKTVLNRFNH